jgi:hypothetical protein
MDSNLDFTNPVTIVVVVAVVLLLLVAFGVALVQRNRRRRSENLRLRFGPEYDRMVSLTNSRKNAEAKLEAREKRIELLKIRDLKPAERMQFLAAWDVVQSRFVDHPRGAVIEADELVSSLLHARGFPAERFEQRAADLSVDHAPVVESYRAANEIAVRAGKDAASTEELRMAMRYYHRLFEELLQAEMHYEPKQALLKQAV